jgi:hypothetical protein
MIYRELDFFAMVSLSQSSCVSPVEFPESILTGEGGGEDSEGVKSYNVEKAWFSINHSVVFVLTYHILTVVADLIPGKVHSVVATTKIPRRYH